MLDAEHILVRMLNQPKIAQIAAYMLSRGGGQMNVLKLTKLLYLSEREAITCFGSMMAGDSPHSMPEGPVLTQTLDLTNGALDSVPGGWNNWVTDKADYEVALNPKKKGFDRDDLDELSNAEIEVLDCVWKKFGHMEKYEIRDWTHKYCKEWEDPHGSSFPIPLERIYKAVGYSNEQSKVLHNEAVAEKYLDRLFSEM